MSTLQARTDKFVSTFIKSNGDIQDRSIKRAYIKDDACVFPSGVFASGIFSNANMPSLKLCIDNNSAIASGLLVGDFYRDGGDPDHVCVVH